MSEKQLKEIAKRYFELYPDRKVLYATEDGNIFLDRSPAVDHSVKSKQKWFELTRGESTEIRTDIDTDKETQDQLKAEAVSMIDPKYQDMLRILRGLRCLPESTKKVDVIVAFNALRSSLLDEIEKPGQDKIDPENTGDENIDTDGEIKTEDTQVDGETTKETE